jgi:hypothetical protein
MLGVACNVFVGLKIKRKVDEISAEMDAKKDL